MSENPFTDGQQFSAARLNSMYNAHQNEGVLNGLDVSTSTNAFDVDVASGELFLNDDVVSVGSATLSLSTSDPEDRIDLISADSTGLTVTQGTPAATSGQPIAPDIPSGDVLVSLIYVRGGSTEILTGDIFNDYKTVLTRDIPDLEANTARVETAPSNPTDVVRREELVSGNPHANSASVNDLPVVQKISASADENAPDGVFASFSFTEAYVLAAELVASAGSSASSNEFVECRIETNNFSDRVRTGLDAGTYSNAISGKDFNDAGTVEFIKETSNDFGPVNAQATVLVIEP